MASIRDIIDINSHAVERLSDLGIRTQAQLLEAGSTSTARMSLADKTTLDDEAIKRWVHQADLMRVGGIGPELAHLLCQVGVCTAPKLAYRAPDSLHAELATANNGQHAMRGLPGLHELHGFITEAKALPKLIRH